jgi:hypothetical protein
MPAPAGQGPNAASSHHLKGHHEEILNFIDGQYVKCASGKTFEKTPIDNSLVGLVYEAGKPEVDAAVAAARAALHGPWGKLPVNERVKLLDAVAEGINNRFDDFLAAEVADTGKPHTLASHVDIPRGAANFKIFADTIKNAATESFEMATPDGKTARSYTVRARVCYCRGLPVEPAAAFDDMESRAGACMRQHGCRQAFGETPSTATLSAR